MNDKHKIVIEFGIPKEEDFSYVSCFTLSDSYIEDNQLLIAQLRMVLSNYFDSIFSGGFFKVE